MGSSKDDGSLSSIGWVLIETVVAYPLPQEFPWIFLQWMFIKETRVVMLDDVKLLFKYFVHYTEYDRFRLTE